MGVPGAGGETGSAGPTLSCARTHKPAWTHRQDPAETHGPPARPFCGCCPLPPAAVPLPWLPPTGRSDGHCPGPYRFVRPHCWEHQAPGTPTSSGHATKAPLGSAHTVTVTGWVGGSVRSRPCLPGHTHDCAASGHAPLLPRPNVQPHSCPVRAPGVEAGAGGPSGTGPQNTEL